MRTFDFTLRLDFEHDGKSFVIGEAFLDHVEGPLYDAFDGRITVSVSESTATLHCHIPANSIAIAVAQVVGALASLGYRSKGGASSAQKTSEFVSTVELPTEDILGRDLAIA